jgi:Uma2 family endonuclease
MSERVLKAESGAPNIIGEAASGRLWLVPLSVEQYDRMIDEGILPEDTGVELLDGLIVRKDRGDAGGDPMTVGEQHGWVVQQLAHLGSRLDPQRLYLQTQQPIVIGGHGEPEPDAAIVLRPLRALGKPTVADVSCVIEVAGTSLERDRTTKLRHYAHGGIPQYLIFDLAARAVEEHLEPDRGAGTYGRRAVHALGGSLRLRLEAGAELEVPVADLFPS